MPKFRGRLQTLMAAVVVSALVCSWLREVQSFGHAMVIAANRPIWPIVIAAPAFFTAFRFGPTIRARGVRVGLMVSLAFTLAITT